MTKLESDPKLKAAMEEIKPILAKYDCMATVLLASPTHSEFLFAPEASWSVCRWEPRADQPDVLRFRSKLEDFPNKEAQREVTENTVHGLVCLQFLSHKMYGHFTSILKQLSKHMDIKTTKPVEIPHVKAPALKQ